MYILIALGVIARLIPHWPNFVPIGSIGIFGSNRFGPIKAAISIILIMVITDLFIGFSFASIFVYIGMLTYVLWGLLIKKGLWGYAVAPVAGSISFFIISNIGVWLGPWYTHDFAGFIRCFTLAIPFYKFTLLSDIIFTTVLFGSVYVFKKYKISGLRLVRKPDQKEISYGTRDH